jgi:hypothetical protein
MDSVGDALELRRFTGAASIGALGGGIPVA